MPESIWRSVPVPSSRMNLRSLSLFLTASQLLTLTTRKSPLAEGVEVHVLGELGLDLNRGQGGPAGLLLELLQLGELLIHVDAREERVALVDGDVRGQGAPLTGGVPGAELLGHAYLTAALAVLSGMNGVNSWVQIRSASSRLYMTVARRSLLASSLASTQGAVSSIYLFAREMTLKTSSRAAWVWKVSSAFRTCRAARRPWSSARSPWGRPDVRRSGCRQST